MTTDNALNALEQILVNLPEEDKQRLAALLIKQTETGQLEEMPVKEDTDRGGLLEKAPKKRRQRRGGKATGNKPVKKQKKKKQHRGMGEGTGNARIARTESIELGQTLNLFDASADKEGSKKDVKIDKILWGDNKPVPRLGRKPEFVTATCSKCEFEFEEVPIDICYQDDEGLVFCCDDCGARR